jgi:hypothetical protein
LLLGHDGAGPDHHVGKGFRDTLDRFRSGGRPKGDFNNIEARLKERLGQRFGFVGIIENDDLG